MVDGLRGGGVSCPTSRRAGVASFDPSFKVAWNKRTSSGFRGVSTGFLSFWTLEDFCVPGRCCLSLNAETHREKKSEKKSCHSIVSMAFCVIERAVWLVE
jgi:hypothetical protein